MRNPIHPDALLEHYRCLSDEELLGLVGQGQAQYTDTAWALLQGEVARRCLTEPVREPEPIREPAAAPVVPTTWERVGMALITLVGAAVSVGLAMLIMDRGTGISAVVFFGGLFVYMLYRGVRR